MTAATATIIAAHTPNPNPAADANTPPASSVGSAQQSANPATPRAKMPDVDPDRRAFGPQQSCALSSFMGTA